MSRTRIVGGNITRTTGGNYKIFSDENIEIYSNKMIIQNGGENGVSFGTPENPPKLEEVIQMIDVERVAYETDGHYSTVYLVCLMLGISEEKSLELAIATENPDTDVHSETDFELDDTWSDAEFQESIHALTGGFHGVEEFFTAIKILYTPNKDTTKIGELLHRFGDSYAHTKIDNLVPEDLNTYNLYEHPENRNKAIESWKGKKGENLGKKITPWLTFFNYYMIKYPDFLTNIEIQKETFGGKDLKDTLRYIYLLKPSDKYIMYGGEKNPYFGGVTEDHNASDKGYPDLIYMRPDWYLTYVKNLSWILATKFKKNLNNLDISIFIKMTEFAKRKKCTMKGLIDYEIAKKRNKKEVIIPVFYSTDRFFASIDAVFNSDYYKTATEVVKNTKEYIALDGKKVLWIKKVKGEEKFNSDGFFDTLAFKIRFE